MKNGQPTIEAKVFDDAGVGWYKINGVWCRGVTSVIGKAFPKDDRLLKWIAQNGVNGETIRDDAAQRGTNVHRAISDLVKGVTLQKARFPKDEWKCLCSFINWYEDIEPKIEAMEQVVYDTRYKLAGTMDARAVIDGERFVVDFKTSSQIYETHEIQTQTYAKLSRSMGQPVDRIGILRLNSKHKRKYEWRERPFDPEVFENVMLPCLELFDATVDDPFEPSVEVLPETLSIPQALQPSLNGRR